MIRAAAAIVRAEVLPAAASAAAQMQGKSVGQMEWALNILREALQFRLSRIAEETVDRVLSTERDRHTRVFAERVRSALGIDLTAVLAQDGLEDELAVALRRNAALIKSLSDETVKRVESAVSRSVLAGGGHRQLAKTMTDEFGVLQSRARLIARDQTSKWNSDLNRIRQVQAGVTQYRWRTSRDERVRQTHREKEGRVYAWAKPPTDTGHPGEDVQCRCTAEAILDLFED